MQELSRTQPQVSISAHFWRGVRDSVRPVGGCDRQLSAAGVDRDDLSVCGRP